MDIDIRKSVKCRICKEVINYISESEESDRFNVLQHYIDHEKSLKEYIDLTCGYKEHRRMANLEFFSEQKKKFLENSFQEDPEEPGNLKNINTSNKENRNETEVVIENSQFDMGDPVDEDSSDRWLYLEEEDWDLLDAYGEDENLQIDEEVKENNSLAIDEESGISASPSPNDYAWSCDKCGKRFPSKQRLHIHKYCEHRVSSYYGRNSSSRSQNKPRIMKNKSSAFVCEDCDDTSFQKIRDLKKHIFDVHKVPYRGPKFQQGKTFSFNTHAKPLSPMHQNINHDKNNQNLENSHTCDVCNKTFGQQMLLRIHRSLHDVHET